MKTFFKYFVFTIIFRNVSSGYKAFSTELGTIDVCDETIKLPDTERSAVVLNFTIISEDCQFSVYPAPGFDGVFAVIQNLDLQADTSHQVCIDFVVFKDNIGSEKFCGKLSTALADSGRYANENPGYISSGKMDVLIFVASGSAAFTSSLKVAFTSYKSCDRNDGKLVPCKDDYLHCINKKYVKDGIVNCPFSDCADEGRCVKQVKVPIPPQSTFGTKVLIGSISSLFMLFIIFVLVVWACKKHKVLCWAESFSQGQTTAESQTTANAIVLNEDVGSRLSGHTQLPNNSQPSISADKDLPPSYDSLFPS